MFESFRPAISSPVSLGKLIALALVMFAAAYICEDWIAGASLLVLWLAWQWLRFDDAPPVLPLALTFHWGQIVSGMFYNALTGRVPLGMTVPKYREMMLLGLGCLLAITVGLAVGEWIVRTRMRDREHVDGNVVGTPVLVTAYAIAVVSKSMLLAYMWDVPELAQGILALSYFRLALLYLLVRRFIRADRFALAGAFVLVEVALGFTGFFAEFREPLFITIVCAIEMFDGRRTKHWVAVSSLVLLSVVGGILWMGIRSPLRQDLDPAFVNQSKADRLSFVATLAGDWYRKDTEGKRNDFDAFIDRLWDVYYPALALDRVPKVLPHEGGTIMLGALQHIFAPRLFFPNKAEIESDSLQVRRYSGVWVAGPERGTTIAFGYAIQSYIDFGYPWMFAPALLYGFFMGMAFRWALKIMRTRELAVGMVTVIFWMSLYTFNRSWPRMLGLALTMMVYLGGAIFIIDRYLRMVRGMTLPPGLSSVPMHDSAVRR